MRQVTLTGICPPPPHLLPFGGLHTLTRSIPTSLPCFYQRADSLGPLGCRNTTAIPLRADLMVDFFLKAGLYHVFTTGCLYIYYVHLPNAGYVQHLLFLFPFCHTTLPHPPFLSPPCQPQADGSPLLCHGSA